MIYIPALSIPQQYRIILYIIIKRENERHREGERVILFIIFLLMAHNLIRLTNLLFPISIIILTQEVNTWKILLIDFNLNSCII